jgi:hypothetical protein
VPHCATLCHIVPHCATLKTAFFHAACLYVGCYCHSQQLLLSQSTAVTAISRINRRLFCGNSISLLRGNGKAIPLQAWTGPEGSRRLRLPDFMSQHMKVLRLSATWTCRLSCPGNIPGIHFCLRLSRPRDRKDYVNEKFQWHHLE